MADLQSVRIRALTTYVLSLIAAVLFGLGLHFFGSHQMVANFVAGVAFVVGLVVFGRLLKLPPRRDT